MVTQPLGLTHFFVLFAFIQKVIFFFKSPELKLHLFGLSPRLKFLKSLTSWLEYSYMFCLKIYLQFYIPYSNT